MTRTAVALFRGTRPAGTTTYSPFSGGRSAYGTNIPPCGADVTCDDQHGVYAFARQWEEETLVVVLNNGSTRYDLNVPVAGLFPDSTTLYDLWEGGQAQVAAGWITGATLPPRSGVVLSAEENLG